MDTYRPVKLLTVRIKKAMCCFTRLSRFSNEMVSPGIILSPSFYYPFLHCTTSGSPVHHPFCAKRLTLSIPPSSKIFSITWFPFFLESEFHKPVQRNPTRYFLLLQDWFSYSFSRRSECHPNPYCFHGSLTKTDVLLLHVFL